MDGFSIQCFTSQKCLFLGNQEIKNTFCRTDEKIVNGFRGQSQTRINNTTLSGLQLQYYSCSSLREATW